MSEENAALIEENEAIKSFIAHRDAGKLRCFVLKLISKYLLRESKKRHPPVIRMTDN